MTQIQHAILMAEVAFSITTLKNDQIFLEIFLTSENNFSIHDESFLSFSITVLIISPNYYQNFL